VKLETESDEYEKKLRGNLKLESGSDEYEKKLSIKLCKVL
jgi:hypothetical protein